MQKIYTDYKGKLRAGNIDLFLQISVDLHQEFLELNKSIRKLDKEKEKSPESIKDVPKYFDDQERIIHETWSLKKRKYKISIQGIIMLATYFESLINEIGIIELGSKYYKENLDKLSIQAKWEIVLKLIYSQTIDKNSREYEALNNIIVSRNKIVHYKTKAIQPKKEDIDEQREFANKMINTFEYAIKNLKGFHKTLSKIDEGKDLLKSQNFQLELNRF